MSTPSWGRSLMGECGSEEDYQNHCRSRSTRHGVISNTVWKDQTERKYVGLLLFLLVQAECLKWEKVEQFCGFFTDFGYPVAE